MNKKLEQRYSELETECGKIESSKTRTDGIYGQTTVIDSDLFTTWKVKVKHLLSISCGESSQHFLTFSKGEDPRTMESSYDIFKRLKSIFWAAKDDFCGGYMTSIKNLIQAEVFESELEQADELLKNGYKLASAVIAGVVIETALRDLCSKEGIVHGNLNKMNTELYKAGAYNKLHQKKITALADIRNSAAHGKPEEFSEKDVESMIRDIEGLLLTVLA